MLYELINVPEMLDILVLSFLSDIVYYFSVLSFSPAPSLLPYLHLGTFPSPPT